MTHVANVTIDNTKVSADLTDFPVYVDLSNMPAAFWSTVASGGGDIRCYKSDGTTELAREVVSCDTGTETGELHVKYTGTLSSSADTVIQIHADGTSSDYAVGATYGRNSVWSDYVVVYHGDDTTDSTGTFNLTANNGAQSGVSGIIGDAFELDGVNDFFSNNSVNINGAASGSITHWSKTDTTYGNGIAVYGSDGTFTNTYNGYGFSGAIIEIHSSVEDSRTRMVVQADHPNAGTALTPLASKTVTDPFYYAGTWNYSGSAKAYENASLEATQSLAAFTRIANSGTIFRIGTTGDQSRHFDGILDEVRFTTSELSADWITTEYNNQNSPSTFYTASAVGGATVSPFGNQNLQHSYQPIAASRLNGVLQ